MTNLAWYTGVIVNSTIAVALILILFFRILRNDRKSASVNLLLNGVLSILGLLVSSAGTLLLYLQQGAIQLDLTNIDTIFPIFLLVGYSVALIGFLGVILFQSQIRLGLKFIIQGGLAAAFIILGLGMMDYDSYWNDGAVLVVFRNFTVEMMVTYLSMIVAIIGLSYAILQRLSFTELVDTDFYKERDRSSSSLLIAAFFFAIQFAVPRATIESVTNPVSVKIIGLIIIIGYAYYLLEYIRAVPKAGISNTEVSKEVEESTSIGNRDVLTIGGSTLVIAFYVVLMRLGFPILTVFEKIDLGLPIFQIGELRGNTLFIDPFGCLFPLAIAIVIVVVTLLKYRKWNIPDSSILFVILSSAFLSFLISFAIYLSSDSLSVDFQPSFSVFPFIISSLLSWFVMIQISNRGIISNWKQKTFTIPRIEYLTPLLVYAGNTIAALIFDISIADSPFGIIQIGGAGFLDGLLWAPLLSAAFLSIFIILYRLLWPQSEEQDRNIP
ncbi:MAG: hypothetical protein E4H14_07480 [Candidatus Thorarchaeota archaeon]|nr:MAG: hypothetical protein E4H14_07480 [Candidatus Thorarchaeota archaeon]